MEEPGERKSSGSSCGYMVMEQGHEAPFFSSVAFGFKGRALGKESFGQPSSTPNKSLGLLLTTSPFQRLSTETRSQCCACILHTMYSSVSMTKLLLYSTELTKVHMSTALVNKVPYSNSHKEQLFRLDLFYAEVGELSDPKKQCQNLMSFNTCTETQLWYVCKCFPVYYFSNI